MSAVLAVCHGHSMQKLGSATKLLSVHGRPNKQQLQLEFKALRPWDGYPTAGKRTAVGFAG